MDLDMGGGSLIMPRAWLPWWCLGCFVVTVGCLMWWKAQKQLTFLKGLLGFACMALFGWGWGTVALGFEWVSTRGHSMAPTFPTGRWLVVNPHAYQWPWAQSWHRSIQVGEVVMFQDPESLQERFLIKRVIARAGDQVDHLNDQIFINGVPLMKPVPFHGPIMDWYRQASVPVSRRLILGEVQFKNRPVFRVLASAEHRLYQRWRVPEGHVFVVGDNWANSWDSRDFGPLPIELVYGRVRGKWDWQDGWIEP